MANALTRLFLSGARPSTAAHPPNVPASRSSRTADMSQWPGGTRRYVMISTRCYAATAFCASASSHRVAVSGRAQAASREDRRQSGTGLVRDGCTPRLCVDACAGNVKAGPASTASARRRRAAAPPGVLSFGTARKEIEQPPACAVAGLVQVISRSTCKSGLVHVCGGLQPRAAGQASHIQRTRAS